MRRLLLESGLGASAVLPDQPAGNDICSDVSESLRIVNAD